MLVLTLISSLLGAFIANATLNPPHSISLLPPGGAQLLERPNEISSICATGTADLEKCTKEALRPKEYYLKVYERPSVSSRLLGKIVVTVTPGKGLEYTYVEQNNSSKKFVPDFFEMDAGYFFLFTVIQKEGDWVQLPKVPFSSPVWINPKIDWGEKASAAKPLQLDTVYNAGSLGAIVFLSFKGNQATYRQQNDNDRPCGEEQDKEVDPGKLKPQTVLVDKLFDRNGHLAVWPQYLGGC